jgi:hypothetical protein
MAKETIKDIHVIWMTTGLSCDGDSVAMNPVISYENGDELMNWWYQAERGELDPFVLVLEGSVPNEEAIRDNHHGHGSGGWLTQNLKTAVGGSRLVDLLSGDQLPRIC